MNRRITLELVSSIGTTKIGELEVDIDDIQGCAQNYEASIVYLKNGRAHRVNGCFKTIEDLRRL